MNSLFGINVDQTGSMLTRPITFQICKTFSLSFSEKGKQLRVAGIFGEECVIEVHQKQYQLVIQMDEQSDNSGYRSDVKQYRLDNFKMDKTIIKHDGYQFKIQEQSDYVTEDQHPSQSSENKQQFHTPYHQKRKPKVTIATLNPSDGPWWQKIFPCCTTETVEPQYQDCDYCQRRVYKQQSQSSEQQPYISPQRMRERQKQPINIFCDRLDNNQLVKNSWQ